MMRGLDVATHYVRRFFAALSSRPPTVADVAWAATRLAPAEFALWHRLSNYDRRHLIESARMVERALDDLAAGSGAVGSGAVGSGAVGSEAVGSEAAGSEADAGVWIRAALLHDVGKFDSNLGVIGRVAATVLAYGIGHGRVRAWLRGTGWRRRIGSYEMHGEIGATAIRAVGGTEEAAQWSELHHHPEEFESSLIPPDYLRILDAADR